MLTEETKNSILSMQKAYPCKRSALIPSLHLAQAEKGYLALETQQEIAILFDISLNEVQSVVSFYDMFYERPVGKHIIHICKNVPCMLHGSDELIKNICSHLKIQCGETTEDGEITILACECLAACDRAPMMLVDETVMGPIKESDIPKILSDVKNTKGHPSPVKNEIKHE